MERVGNIVKGCTRDPISAAAEYLGKKAKVWSAESDKYGMTWIAIWNTDEEAEAMFDTLEEAEAMCDTLRKLVNIRY